MRYSVDPKSYDLAVHFLPAGAPEEMTRDLAQTIQDAVEGWGDPAKCSRCGEVLRDGYDSGNGCRDPECPMKREPSPAGHPY